VRVWQLVLAVALFAVAAWWFFRLFQLAGQG